MGYLMDRVSVRVGGILLMLVLVSPAHSASPWRYWNKADGLMESWVFGLTSDAEGHVVVKHGEVPSETLLDGYRINTIPSNHSYGRLLSPPQRNGAAEGELWTFDTEGILIHDASGWHKYPDSDIAGFAKSSRMALIPWYLYSISRFRGAGQNDRMDVVPIGNHSAVIMFPDRLVEWNRATGKKRLIRIAAQTALKRFLDAQSSFEGGLWLTGENGIAHLEKSGERFDWDELPAPSGLTDLKSPIEGRAGEVFLSGRRPDGKRALFIVQESAWKEVFVGGPEALKGWRGPDGAIWIQRGDQLMQLDGSTEASPTKAVASGLTAVLNEPGQNFWIATNEGIGRYSPSLWRTPSEAAWIDAPVLAINEDREGRVWFLTGKFLIVKDHEKWRRSQLPTGSRSALLIDTLLILENGEVVMRADSLADPVAFNPHTRKFRFVKHPDGKRTGFIARRKAGSIWVQVFEDDGIHWRLQAYDGTKFLPPESFPLVTVNDLRLILEARNGDMWIGTPSSLSVLRNGKLSVIGPKEGFADTGVFSAVETANGKLLLGGRESVTEFDGKSFHVVKSIDLAEHMSLGVDGSVWASSGSGVHRYLRSQWISDSVEEGLPSAAVHEVYADFEGRVWAGTSRGIGLYYPGADPDPPATSIVDGRNLRETPPGGEVRLAFSGVDKWKFTSPDRLTFSWRLDNSAWSDFDPSQFASFTALRSGGHHFEVRAMDRNGNVDAHPASFLFTVLTPWYNARGFYIVAGLGLLALLFLLRTAAKYHGNLKFQSRHDPLTLLPNRLEFEDVLSSTVVRATRPVAVMFIDLDGFKQVNDLYGHKAGDALLQEVSLRIGKCIRPSDTLARLGGDEFTIVMPATERDRAAAIADVILVSLRRSFLVEGHSLELSASVGIGLCPDHGRDATTLLRLADIAMYQSKANNKNCYRFYDSSMEDGAARKSEIVALLRSSLENNGFLLQYQPIVDSTGTVVQMEGLIRINTPAGAVIPPDDFIGVAEETGLIYAVGDWVLANACRQARAWRDAGFDIRVAINVSPLQLESPDFAEKTLMCVAAAGLPASSIGIEITETRIIRSRQQAHAALQQLRLSGLSVSLDDFGTGYSSLSILANLPVDGVKIDRSFIAQLTTNSRTLDLIGETIRLTHKLGLQITAEGIEEQIQLELLRKMDCDLFQGYLIAPPIDPKDATAFLAGQTTTRQFVSIH
jgi:diguanylate cyclase (GGDEF)-like protein